MFRSTVPGSRLIRLTEAFNSDGFEVARVCTYNNRIGITAESKSVFNYDTGKPKKAYYVEGTPYETGFLMGSMAEEEVSRMMEYTDKVVFSFIHSKVLEKIKLIQGTLIRIVYELSKKAWNQLPEVLREEIRGLYDGCKSRNPKTRVNMERLIVLNTGIDIICSMVYSGNFFRIGMEGVEPEDFDIPMMCNAFTVCGKSAANGCYFGRDFTFPTSDVFQDTAALIVYAPMEPIGQGADSQTAVKSIETVSRTALDSFSETASRLASSRAWNAVSTSAPAPGSAPASSRALDRASTSASTPASTLASGPAAGPALAGLNEAESVLKGRSAISFVNIAAPGMIGSIAAMNMQGVAFGVNMSPGSNCDPEKIGVNSLLMARLCAQYSTCAEDAASLMGRLPKGVSWLYIIADGTGRSCIAEAGASWPKPDFTQYPDEEYRTLLPSAEFLERHATVPYQNGVMFRWNDYKYPLDYLAFNHQLWQHYNERNKKQNTIYTGAFEETGYINRTGDQNCPSSFYFAPQREESDELLVASNHYIIPEMRYFAMHRWTQRIVGKRVNDIQWRYDELHRQLRDRLAENGSIGLEAAKDLISFLAPYRKYKSYYADNPKSSDGKEIRIEGALSVFDLKNKAVESHYGYYCDKWIRLTLPSYF